MDTATPEKIKSPTSEMGRGITTPEGDHQQLVENVVRAVQQPPYTVEQAQPAASAAIPASPELTQVNAQRVGSEKLTLSEKIGIRKRDIKDWLRWFRGLLFMGSNKIRGTPSFLFAKFRRKKISDAAKPENQYNPNQDTD